MTMKDLSFAQACPHCNGRLLIPIAFWNQLFFCKHCGVEIYTGRSIADVSPRAIQTNEKSERADLRAASVSKPS